MLRMNNNYTELLTINTNHVAFLRITINLCLRPTKESIKVSGQLIQTRLFTFSPVFLTF